MIISQFAALIFVLFSSSIDMDSMKAQTAIPIPACEENQIHQINWLAAFKKVKLTQIYITIDILIIE